MASDVSGANLRGLLIHDSRITYADSFNATGSTITQAGPEPGDPEPQQETDCVLESSGTQSASGKLRIRCIKAGNGEINGGRFAWQNQGDDLWRGWEPPHNLAAFEFLDWTTTASKWLHPHAITLSNGKVLAVVQKSSQTVACFVMSTAGVWTETEVYDKGSAYATGAFPCVVQRPDGRILCFFITEDATAAESQVRMFYSSDDGATWTFGGGDLLSSAIDTSTYTPTRMRVAMLPNGHMTLMVGLSASLTYDSIAYQYASTNSGARFDLIDSTGWSGATDTTSLGYLDLCVVDNRIMLAYLREGSTTRYRPYVRFIGSVNQLFSAAEEIGAYQSSNAMDWCSKSGAGAYQNGDLAVVRDEDGVLYMIGRDEAANRECYSQRSTDGGATWAMVSYGSAAGLGGAWWNSADSAIYPKGWAATMQAGRIVLLTNFSSDADTHDPSLAACFIGGYSTVTLPFKNKAALASDVIAFERTYLPFSKPSDTPVFTESATGAAASALGSAGLVMTASAGEDMRYIATSSTAIDQGYIVLCQVKVSPGQFVINARVANATPVSYTVRVMVSPTSIILRDTVGATDVATLSTTEAVTGVQLLLAVGNANGALGNTGKARLWYRPVTSGNDEDREWILIGSSSTITAGATSGDELYFGMLTSNPGTVATVRMFSHTFGEYTGQQLYGGQSNPSELCGRQFSSTPLWVNDGVKIRATSGPAYSGDTWYINTRYQCGIENCFAEVSASPDRTWRSTDETQHDIVLDIDTEETRPLGGTLAIYLGNINFRTFSIAGMDLGTNTFADIFAGGDSADGQDGLSFDRHGSEVAPSTANTGAVSDYYYPFNILAGSRIVLNSGGTHTYHKITRSSEGAWRRDAGTTKVARAFITGTDNTIPTGGLLQTAHILSKDVVVVIPAPGTYSQLRIRIDAQDTAEGYFQIGTIRIGHIAYFGRQYSRGRSLAVDPLFDMKEARNGRRRVRERGPARRGDEFAWVDGVDTSGMHGTSPTPDYVTSYTSGEIVASSADTPHQMLGIIEALGPVEPVVYLPAIVRGATSAAYQIVDRSRFLYGRIVSAGRIENVLGDEHVTPGEVFTVGVVRIEEEL